MLLRIQNPGDQDWMNELIKEENCMENCRIWE
jgi:hypothetical protein